MGYRLRLLRMGEIREQVQVTTVIAAVTIPTQGHHIIRAHLPILGVMHPADHVRSLEVTGVTAHPAHPLCVHLGPRL